MGFGLRAARLDAQSLWYDEGSSIFLSRQSLGVITAGAAHDIHPPLYYYLLHAGIALGGQSEYAVRFLSVASGVLTVALLYALGRRLFGPRVGAIAALLGAASPLAVYYSQEARMYAQVTMFGLLSTYVLARATGGHAAGGFPRSAGLWLGYALAATACLYSQYLGALVLAFHGAYVLACRRKALLPFVLAAGAAVLTFTPWLALAKDSLLGWPSTDAFHAGPELFGDAAVRYVLGLSATVQPVTVALTAAVCAVAAAGLWPKTNRLPILPALYVAIPLVLMFLLGLRRPVYNPKFALLALPGFLLLLALGIRRLRWPGMAGLGLALAAAAFALDNYYTNPEFARDDYRGLAHFIATSQRPGDVVILNAPGQEQIFPYYYHGGLPVLGLPADRPLNENRTAQQLAQLNQQFKRLWLVLYGTNGSDPNGYVERWLAGHDFEIQNQWFGNVRLATFAVPLAQPATETPADATIGGFAHLAGYSLAPQPVASGDVLQLGLKWQAAGQAPGNEKVFTHVIDAEGNIWGQRDSDPAGGARPTSGWRTGESIDDNYGLLILPGTPPGQYRVELGMYDPLQPAQRLPITQGGDGDRLLLGPIEIGPAAQPPSIDELRIPHPLEHPFGPIRLLGYGLTLVGQDAERTTFSAGDEAHLTLFWQADQAPSTDAQLSLEASGQGLASGMLLPRHPTSTWQAGDRYRDQYRLRLPGTAGQFELSVRVNGQLLPLARIGIR
jgi:mannosyltransferase